MTQMPMATLKGVKCILGNVRHGHGLELVLKFPDSASIRTVTDVQFDLCGDVYAAMPPGTATAANWMLPRRVRGSFEQSNDHGAELYYTFLLGARKLSHATLQQRLADVKAAGDPPFLIDLICNCTEEPRLLCRVATRASSIQMALSSASHELQLVEPIPESLVAEADARRVVSPWRMALLLLRWWLFPILFTFLGAGLLIAPSETSYAVSWILPRVIRLHKPSAVRSISAVLPPVPQLLSQAFMLGDLSARYFGSGPRNATLLEEAATLLSRDQPLSEEELAGVLAQLQKLEQHVGLVTRVRGFFSFVNTMWLMAIVGIAVSIGPSLFVILRPLRDLLKRWAKWIFHRVVQPFARCMHDYGVFELFAWQVCGGIVLQAQDHVGEEIALYVAITGMALACPALSYSTLRHAGKLKSKDQQALPRMISIWLAATAAVVAMAHNSRFLGYVSVVAFYAAIGFQVVSYGLCICIGFNNDSAMERCALTSFILLSSTSVMRLLNASYGLGLHFAPFQSAISVFGCIVLFLALLIMSSRFYYPQKRYQSIRQRWGMGCYRFANALTLALLLGFMAVGSVGAMHGMANTATVFLVLWLVEKYADFHCSSEWSGWVLMLVLSVLAWRSALWLHLRPEFVASLFDVDIVDRGACVSAVTF